MVRGLLLAAVLSVDGGTAGSIPAPAAPVGDGGIAAAPAPPQPSAETLQLRAELEAMRVRVQVLEQQNELARQQNELARQQVQQLEQAVQTLEAIRAEAETANQERQANQRAAAQYAANAQAAVDALMGAVNQLQTGDTNIEGALSAVESANIGTLVQKDINLARQALGNGDLGVCGSYLVQAITDAQAGR
jgi:TolA-binding protein